MKVENLSSNSRPIGRVISSDDGKTKTLFDMHGYRLGMYHAGHTYDAKGHQIATDSDQLLRLLKS